MKTTASNFNFKHLSGAELCAVAAAAALALLPGVSGNQCSLANAPANDEVSKGRVIFHRATCDGCHPNGDNILNPTHPIKGSKFQTRYKDDNVLSQVIRHGFPSSGMPPFPKDKISEKDMKSLIAYIRSLTPPGSK